MSKREDYEARTEALLLPIMEEMNFELVDVEYVKEGSTWYLRAYIDKEVLRNSDRIYRRYRNHSAGGRRSTYISEK